MILKLQVNNKLRLLKKPSFAKFKCIWCEIEYIFGDIKKDYLYYDNKNIYFKHDSVFSSLYNISFICCLINKKEFEMLESLEDDFYYSFKKDKNNQASILIKNKVKILQDVFKSYLLNFWTKKIEEYKELALKNYDNGYECWLKEVKKYEDYYIRDKEVESKFITFSPNWLSK